VQAVAQTGNTSVALSLLDEHEERFAAEPRFHLVRAEVAEQAGDFPAACDAYRRVLMLGHDDPDVQAALGLCQYWAGRYRQAVQTLDELIKQAKEPEAPLMCAYAGALLRTHQTARAVDWLERFTSQRSDVTQLWVLLAQGRATLGDLNGAVLAAGRAARLSPQSPDVLAVTATTYLAAGKAEAARQTAEYALQFDADNLETLIVLGRACEHLNDRTTARSAYARALELQDSPFVAELLARVSDEQ
jgi:predicted Zn-dependent protease